MIPRGIVDHLERHSIPYQRRLHRRAVTAQELAAAVHVPGRRVVKSVLVKAGEKIWIAVLPATGIVDEARLAAALGAPAVRLLYEPEFEGLFPDCEAGAEPPFGALYGVPIIIDSALDDAGRLIFRAGSHEEAIELDYDDFCRLENDPPVSAISRAQPSPAHLASEWSEVSALET